MQESLTPPLEQPTAAIPDPEPPRPFQCTGCKKSFTRTDHLTRHVRAHTQQKPYVCPICSKGFARVDLLKRHVTNHNSNSTAKRQKKGVPRNTRVVQACESCSRSHLGCEDEKPCSHCKKKNIDCRVPTMFAEENEAANEHDTPPVSQDLLDISNGINHDFSMPLSESNQNPTPPLDINGRTTECSFLPSAPAEQMTPLSELRSTGIDRSLNRSNGTDQDPDLLAMDQLYKDNDNTSLQYLDCSTPNFDEASRTLPFASDCFQNLPPLQSFLSHDVTSRSITGLNFDTDVGFTDLDIGMLDQYSLQIPFASVSPSTCSQIEAQSLEHYCAPARAEAFKRSVWRYTPRRNEHNSSMYQTNLAFPETDKDARRAHIPRFRALSETLDRASRDRMLALVLSTCNAENVKRIASAFPSAELLDGLIQFSLTSGALNLQTWFHLPTLSLTELNPELLACIVSAGAISTPDVTLRKFGFALHEASRLGLGKSLEEENCRVRDLQHVRTFLLQLIIGCWSGVSRKMEIAESFLNPVVTTIHRGGKLRRSTWKDFRPGEEQGQALEAKWHEWAHQESYLRLIYQVFEFDRQSSVALLKAPLMTYSTMHLPLPCSDELWLAKSASAWKAAYQKNIPRYTKKRPSPIDCLLDFDHLTQHDSASTICLYMIWGLIWEFRQLSSLGQSSLVLSSRYQELTKQIEDFHISSPPLTISTEITMQLMSVHLNAPVEEIQLFAGLEGQEEAHSSYPQLRDWTKTDQARRALWHASQILRAAKALPEDLLCNFNAIVIYHAGLVLWGYGMLVGFEADKAMFSNNAQTLVVLNGDDTPCTRRYTTLGRGLPCIRATDSEDIIQLSNVGAVLDTLVHLLMAPFESVEGSCPPLVGNLVQLLEGLRPVTR